MHEAFEDENPFEADAEHIPSETSSASRVDLSEPASPVSPHKTSPSNRPFPSPGSHRQLQTVPKTEFCCARDRLLHSGDDVEILVRRSQTSQTFLPTGLVSS
jgi:hypothetical protein